MAREGPSKARGPASANTAARSAWPPVHRNVRRNAARAGSDDAHVDDSAALPPEAEGYVTVATRVPIEMTIDDRDIEMGTQIVQLLSRKRIVFRDVASTPARPEPGEDRDARNPSSRSGCED